MSNQMMINTDSRYVRVNTEAHGHQYKCYSVRTRETIVCEKLPPILKALRETTNYTFKVPHGNKVRTMILEEGICIIQSTSDVYEITIDRW